MHFSDSTADADVFSPKRRFFTNMYEVSLAVKERFTRCLNNLTSASSDSSMRISWWRAGTHSSRTSGGPASLRFYDERLNEI